MLPNFLILGAEKAGTTWLHEALSRHADIFMPEIKELHFFNRFDSNMAETDRFRRRGLAWYEEQFADHSGQSAVGEATPLYICDPDAPLRIRQTLPRSKLVLTLRNPLTRTQSHFNMARAKGHVTTTLEDAVALDDPRLLRRGLYGRQLETWLSLFPRHQIHIMFFEDLVADPAAALAPLLKFLSVDPEPAATLAATDRSNAATSYRSARIYNAGVRTARALRDHRTTRGLARTMKTVGVYEALKRLNRKPAEFPAIGKETQRRLQRYFAPDVDVLKGLLGCQSCPWPEFSA